MNALPAIAWGSDGLVPVIIVDDRTGAVLTLAYADREAVERTVASRSTWLFSRSRGVLWNKGATSGNTQQVVAIAVDCDADALIYRVIPSGPACHTGSASCFDRALQLSGEAPGGNGAATPGEALAPDADLLADGLIGHGDALAQGADDAADAGRAQVDAFARGADFAAAVSGLAATIAARKRAPVPDSYTAKLFAGGVDRIGKKIGEEATEVVIAAKNADRNELIWETADLLYHTLVLLAQREIALDEVGAELTRRALPKG